MFKESIMKVHKKVSKYHDQFYFCFRVLVGLMFFMHGAQKLFGWFGGTAMGLSNIYGIAGVVETVVGLVILLGLWVRLGALVGSVQMLVAYFYTHVPAGWNPLTNAGELSLLYFVAFLIMMQHGAGKWALESKLNKKERF